MFEPAQAFTPEQQLAFDKAILTEALPSPFFAWVRRELQKERDAAILDLTQLTAKPDNIGEFAACQARLRFATLLLKRPYDLLGIPEPR